MSSVVVEPALRSSAKAFRGAPPFDHCIVDGFLAADVARELAAEFPAFDEPCWFVYDNSLERKRACNDWHRFGPATANVLRYLNSDTFVSCLANLLVIGGMTADPTLHGGGWHLHDEGGRLNPHLDYNLHPASKLQRRLNLIIYLNDCWEADWGGELGLWEPAGAGRGPGRLVKAIQPIFNRAVIFDTTQESWHGLASPVRAPNGRCRKSLGIYYLAPPPDGTEQRFKALYAPTPEQRGDPRVEQLIARRASVHEAHRVWRS